MSLVLIPYSLSVPFSLFLYSTGTLPPELGALTNLEWLYLNNNQLSGKSDSYDGYLPSLPSCNLYTDSFSLYVSPMVNDQFINEIHNL